MFGLVQTSASGGQVTIGLSLIGLLSDVLYIAGLFFLFRKCGIRRIWAFIPGVRNYKLAECADMRDDGAIWLFASVAAILLEFIFYFASAIVSLKEGQGFGENLEKMLYVLLAILNMVQIVYAVRVYFGLCRMFSRRKRWVWAWVFLEGPTAIYWGLSPKFLPEYKYSERYALHSGADVDALEQGLTINIRARTVGSRLRRRYLLRDIHLNILPGHMVLLLGGSGAGKTTFINAVTGYEKADATIVLDGHDVYKEFGKMKYEIGFVPQQELMRYCDTVQHTLEDAAYLRMPASVRREERRQRVDAVIDELGLAPVRDNFVGKQSGGQKKRISIASELISDPSLYVLDEPDSGLDGILARDLMHRLHDISRQGKIVLVITHSPDRVLECFDDVLVLAKDKNHVGRMVFFGPVEEAKKFFGKNSMEEIIKAINRTEEGGEGRADEFIERFGGMSNEPKC